MIKLDKFTFNLLIERAHKGYRFIGRKSRKYLVLGVVVGILSFYVEIAFALLLQEFLRVIGLITPEASSLSWRPFFDLKSVLAFLFLMGATRALLQWAHFYLTQSIVEHFNYEQRSRLIEWAFHGNAASSGLVTTFFAEVIPNTALFLSAIQGLFILLPSALLLFGSLIYLAPLPTLAATGCLCLSGLCMRLLNTSTVSASKEMYAAYHEATDRLLRGMKNLLLLHIYGTQGREEREILRSLGRSRDSRLLSYKLAGAKFAFPQVVGAAAVCIIALTAAYFRSMPPPLLLSYFYLFVRFVQSVAEASKSGSVILFSWPQVQELSKWWADHAYDGVRSRRERTNNNSPAPIDKPIGWMVEHVSFIYPGAKTPTLRDVSVTILPASTLVITGPSGAGKSTLLNLLLGGVEPTSGKIHIIGHGTELINIKTLRARLLETIGYVGPESFLIEGSLRDNILYGLHRSPSEVEIRDAMEKAECQFLYSLPGQLDHHITEQGLGLSAGQKQRLCLARALLRTPKVLILDEATANLDVETETRLIDTLNGLKPEMTIVIVTHRQGLLRIADAHLRLAGAEGTE